MSAAKRLAASFAAGLAFALGLGLSGMTLPSKVLGFLDVAGRWDPSLLCVMGGAVLLGLAVFPSILRRPAPRLEVRFHLPTPTRIDARLVVGSAVFGLGWGLGGVCPGPALVALATLSPGALVFVAAMAAGFGLFEALEVALPRRATLAPPVAEPAARQGAPLAH